MAHFEKRVRGGFVKWRWEWEMFWFCWM